MNFNKSIFVKVRCAECKNEQVIFAKAAHKVKCLVCGAELASSSGGKSKINATVLEVLN